MSLPFRFAAFTVTKRTRSSIPVAIFLLLFSVAVSCSRPTDPAGHPAVDSDQAVEENAEDFAGLEDTEAEEQTTTAGEGSFQLYLRVQTRIPTVGYDCAFAVSFQNRSREVVELPEGSQVVFSFLRSGHPNDQSVIRTVSLERSYRVLPDSFADFEHWVAIPIAGKVNVWAEIREPVAAKSSPITLEVERYLFYDGRGLQRKRPSEPGESEPPGEFLIEQPLPQNPDK